MELLRRYSNTPLPLKAVQYARTFDPHTPVATPIRHPGHIHQVGRRLSAAVIDQLLQDYQTGVPSTELTKRYQLGKGTVLSLLHQHHVAVRRTPPRTAVQIDQAVTWYTAGDSLKQIGQRLDRDAETIRQALKRSGVQLRPAGRPPRRFRAPA